MAVVQGMSFLHRITIGEVTDPNNPGGNILEVSTQAEGDFDKSNLLTDIARQVWRSTDVNEQFIKVKSDVPVQPDTVALIGTNLTSAATVILEANSVDDFTNPPFCVTMQIVNNLTTHAIFLQNLGDPYEFFRFRILDTDNPCGYIEVGRVAGGNAFTFEGSGENFQNDFSIAYRDTSKSLINEGYSRPSNSNILTRALTGTISKMETRSDKDNDNFLGLIELIENVKTNRPFLLILDRNNPLIFTGWVEFTALPTFAYNVNELATATKRNSRSLLVLNIPKSLFSIFCLVLIVCNFSAFRFAFNNPSLLAIPSANIPSLAFCLSFSILRTLNRVCCSMVIFIFFCFSAPSLATSTF